MKSEKPRRGPSEKFSAIVPGCRARKSGTALGVKCRGVRRARRGYQFWDFENYLAETDHQNEIQAVYTNERQSYGNLISQYRKDGAIWTPSYYQYDALGSTRALTDDAGDATDTYVYDAWGNEVASSGTTVNPFRWVGKVGYYWDEGSGTFYIRARVYEPVTGRWMSQDPLGYEGSPWNLYEYVFDNPSVAVDPAGTDAWDYQTKLLGCSVYKALGMQAGGIAQLEVWGLDVPVKAGAASGVYFFPDSCEVGIYSIKAGIVKLLDPAGGPIKVDFEGGYQLGATVEIEGAFFTGPGKADSNSFSGIFFTVEGTGGEGIGVGGSGYVGDANPNGSRWIGGTVAAGVGVDASMITGGSVAYNYQKMGAVNVPYCLCLALIYAMP